MDYKTLRKVQLCELDILKEYIKICDANNFKYYIATGTLLGAVRHKGFVPWDDDIDVYMLRDEYEKFIKIANEYLPSNVKMYNFRNDPNYISYQTIISNEKYMLRLNHTKSGIKRGAWIDVFPLDEMPSNKLAFIIRKYKILYRRFRYQASVFDIMTNVKSKRPLIEKILIFLVDKFGIGKKSNPKEMLEKYDKELKKKCKKPKYYLNAITMHKFKNLMPIEVYGEGKKYEFEGIMVNGPENYDYFLTKLYGDYMSTPQDKERHYSELVESDDE